MVTQEQKQNLKSGDKLIFVENGGVLSAEVGNVFTFSNWKEMPNLKMHYWQCHELFDMGNDSHNFSINHVELFNPDKHKKFRIVNAQTIRQDEDDFANKYGH